jgi:hypothetical protein
LTARIADDFRRLWFEPACRKTPLFFCGWQAKTGDLVEAPGLSKPSERDADVIFFAAELQDQVAATLEIMLAHFIQNWEKLVEIASSLQARCPFPFTGIILFRGSVSHHPFKGGYTPGF